MRKLKNLNCKWEYDDLDNTWNTTCGLCWYMEEPGLSENSMNYCPKCGKKIKELAR